MVRPENYGGSSPSGGRRGAIKKNRLESKGRNPRVRAEVSHCSLPGGSPLTLLSTFSFADPGKPATRKRTPLGLRVNASGAVEGENGNQAMKEHGEGHGDFRTVRQTKPRRVSGTINLPVCSLRCLSSSEQSTVFLRKKDLTGK